MRDRPESSDASESSEPPHGSYADLINRLSEVKEVDLAIGRKEAKSGEAAVERKKGEAQAMVASFAFLERLMFQRGDDPALLAPVRRVVERTMDDMKAATRGRKPRTTSENERIKTAALACLTFLRQQGLSEKAAHRQVYNALGESGLYYHDGGGEPKDGTLHNWKKALKSDRHLKQRVENETEILAASLSSGEAPVAVIQNYLAWTTKES